jgi:uncharacterized Tic20 family protein
MSTTTEDRIWAVLSHLSTLAFGMGIALPVVGWSDQRRKSNYAAFQSLQALGYQSLGFTVWALSFLVILLLALAILVFSPGFTQRIGAPRATILNPGMIYFFILVFGLFALYFVLPVGAAIACALGRDFRYPILGHRLARYLRYQSSIAPGDPAWLDEDHEFRWVTAMGHFSILVFLWGMLAPLTAWLLQGRRNFFLRFQSIQTLVYQALTTVVYFLASFLYLFGFVLLVTGMQVLEAANLSSSLGIIGMLMLGALLLAAILLILLVPLLHILGQWAGYRLLKGDDYHYPLLGRLIEKQILKNSTPERN